MGMKYAQSESNAALRRIFGHIPHVFLIHDDLIIAAKTTTEHKDTLLKVTEAIQNADLTLNPEKCNFSKSEINFGVCFLLLKE